MRIHKEGTLKTCFFLCCCVLTGWMFHACSDLHDDIPIVSKSFHATGWLTKTSQDFHGKFIRNTQWNLAQCQACHGEQYDGGASGTSCLTCHATTPEDCIVCHGGGDNLTGAPPRDLDGNTAVNIQGVGAHTTHLSGATFTDGNACSSCHVVPTSFSSAGHADSDLPAEVTFSELALTDAANPVWDEGSVSCSNSYCHGNWSLAKDQSSRSFIYTEDEIRGNNATPIWTEPSTVVCGSCHNLPPVGHAAAELNQCANCHGSVIDAAGVIIDKSKHVNGNINVFGQESPMF